MYGGGYYGITPACAGKSVQVDHKAGQVKGSPPRMRGKVELVAERGVALRITPACAGKRATTKMASSATQDHPRVCEEKRWKTAAALLMSGSPPRMRGKEIGHLIKVRLIGITPACAGKRQSNCRHRAYRWDHPRVCGEKFYVDEVLPGDTGSPPHMRGKEAVKRHSARGLGITPAYAGKSTLERAIAHNARDHPRVCGEKHSCESVGTAL